MKAEDKEFIYKLSFSRNGAEVKQNGELIRCKNCKWFNEAGCAVSIVDDTDRPSEDDFCSFAERKQEETENG